MTNESFDTKTPLGKNINAPNITNAEPKYSPKTANTTFYDKVFIDLGLIKNIDNSMAATDKNTDNTLTVKFKIVLEDNKFVEDFANYSFNIGVASSDQTLWIGQLCFTASVPPERRPRLQIIPLSNGTNSLHQG